MLEQDGLKSPINYGVSMRLMFAAGIFGMLLGCQQLPDREPPRLLDFRQIPGTNEQPPQYVLCSNDGGPWACQRKKAENADQISAKASPAQNEMRPITFEFDSHELDEVGRSVVSEWLTFANSAAPSPIYLYGYADEVGSAEYNMTLSRKRVDEVDRSLRASGYTGLIVKQAMGSCCYLDMEEGDTDKRINRRVEIRLK